MPVLRTGRVHLYDDLSDPVKMRAAPEERPERVRIAIFNPRNTGLLPAISPFWDREMCGSAVFLYLVREVARSGRGIREIRPGGSPWELKRRDG